MHSKKYGVITVDRETLFKEVWATPGQKLAKKYSVSDVALAKACRRHKIPRPPRGYWAKLAHGKPSRQIPLPALDDPQLQKVRFYGGASMSNEFQDLELAAKKERGLSDTGIVVPKRLFSPHLLVKAISDRFKSKVSKESSSNSTRKKEPPITVSHSSLPRALRILDTLIKTWESLGGQAAIEEYWFIHTKNAIYFGMDQDHIAVTMDETRHRIKSTSATYPWRYEYKYTGQLAIIAHKSGWSGLRAKWADGKKQRLENILDSVVEGLLRYVDYVRQRRLDKEIEQRQEQCAAERRQTAQRREAQEQQLRKELQEQVEQWDYAERIRAYLKNVETSVANGKLEVADVDTFDRWMKWAKWYGDHVDPLVREEPLSEEAPEPPKNTSLKDLEFTSHTRLILEGLGVVDSDRLHELSREEIRSMEGEGPYWGWDEICRVLEGIGYDG